MRTPLASNIQNQVIKIISRRKKLNLRACVLQRQSKPGVWLRYGGCGGYNSGIGEEF